DDANMRKDVVGGSDFGGHRSTLCTPAVAASIVPEPQLPVVGRNLDLLRRQMVDISLPGLVRLKDRRQPAKHFVFAGASYYDDLCRERRFPVIALGNRYPDVVNLGSVAYRLERRQDRVVVGSSVAIAQ